MVEFIRKIEKAQSVFLSGGRFFPYSIDNEDKVKMRYAYLVLPLSMILVATGIILSIPLLFAESIAWSEMNLRLQFLILLVVVTIFCHAYLSFRLGNTLLLFIISFLFSYAAEISGMQWAWPFCGLYHYNTALFPKLPGDVPLFIPLSWFMLSYTAIRFLHPLNVRLEGSESLNRVVLKASLCAIYITAIDIVIDPIATFYNTWFWHEQGIYFGVPLGNFFGWFILSFSICFISLLLEKPIPDRLFRIILLSDLVFNLTAIFLTALIFIRCTIHLNSFLPVTLAMILIGPIWVLSVIYTRDALRKKEAQMDKKINLI